MAKSSRRYRTILGHIRVKDRGGLTPIIAIILLISMVVASFGMVAIVFSNLAPEVPRPDTTVGLDKVYFDNENTVLRFILSGGDPLDVKNLSFNITGVLENADENTQQVTYYVRNLTGRQLIKASNDVGDNTWAEYVWVNVTETYVEPGEALAITIEGGDENVHFTSVDATSLVHVPSGGLLFSYMSPISVGPSTPPPPPKPPLPWLHVEGVRILDDEGNIVNLRGVAVPDAYWLFEYPNRHPNEQDFYVLATNWKANVVRIPIRPWDWKTMGKDYYFSYLDDVINWCFNNDMYALLDWHAKGNPITGIPDNAEEGENWSPEFSLARQWWENAAERYTNNSTVLYDIFNEPSRDYNGTDISWAEWKPMAESLIDIIQSRNPQALIFVPGVDWAKDLRGVGSNPIGRESVVYTAHIYPDLGVEKWDEYWYFVSETYPLIVGEWGYEPASERESYAEPLFARIENRMLPWTAWIWSNAWWPEMITYTGWATYATTDFGDYAKWKLTTPFTTSVSPTSGNALQGGSTTTTVSVRQIVVYSQTVTLTPQNAPPGVMVSFSPPSGTPSFSSTMTIEVDSSVSPGTYILTVKGTGAADGKVNTCKYTLTVTSAGDTSVYNFETGPQGWMGSGKVTGTTHYTLDAAAGSGSLQCTIGLVDTGDVYVNPSPSVNLSNATITVWVKFPVAAAEGYGANIKLYLKYGSSPTWVESSYWDVGSAALPAGVWTQLTWTGVSYTDVKELGLHIYTDATTHAPSWDSGTFLIDAYNWVDFDISVSPGSGSVAPGGSTTSNVSINSFGNYQLTVSLMADIATVPPNVTVDFSTPSGIPPFSSAMTVNVEAATPGTYPITVRGIGTDGKTHTRTYTLTVQGAVGIIIHDFESTNEDFIQGNSSTRNNTRAHNGSWSIYSTLNLNNWESFGKNYSSAQNWSAYSYVSVWIWTSDSGVQCKFMAHSPGWTWDEDHPWFDLTPNAWTQGILNMDNIIDPSSVQSLNWKCKGDGTEQIYFDQVELFT